MLNSFLESINFMVIYIVRELYLYIFQYNMIYQTYIPGSLGAINEAEQLGCN